MTIFNQIVPGKVNNRGINDKSIPEYTVNYPVYPLHLPVVSLVTAKGEIAGEKGTQFINLANFDQIFGKVNDHKTPYYNPIALLIQQLGLGGQSVIGVRRLSANTAMSRVALSAFVQKVTVQDFERDLSGAFKRDENGDKIATGTTFEGIKISVKPDPEAAKGQYGKLANRVIPGTPAQGDTPAVPEIQVFPLVEYAAGIGDAYNASGLNMGVTNSALNWKSVSSFVKATGVFPYELKMFTDSDAGVRTYSKTTEKRESAQFTFFPTELNGTQYSVKRGVGLFTNTNQNRKVVPTPSPFKEAYVYDTNIDTICQLMYVVEKDHNDTLVEVSDRPYQQMNFLTCTNHLGAPYYAVVGDDTPLWDLSGSVKSSGGINPFYNDKGELPDYVTKPEIKDPFGLLEGVKQPLSSTQAWEITNKLLAADLKTYVNGSEIKNYTRNRQSVMWDVGFSKEVKDIAVQLLASRRDIFVFQDATVWDPTLGNDLGTVYSRFSSLAAAARMYPESEQWGTATCRSAINLIEAKLTNELTGSYFSGNLDLAYAFAAFAGNSAGIIVPAASPDHGDNRILRTMHSPNIEFEEDEIANDNFENGGITLRPYDVEQLFRPALITVYNNDDSVLKDAVTAFLCVCIEKIVQDEWNTVCGDTSYSAANYAALVKDGAERKLRDRLGGLVPQMTVETSYDETRPGGRAILNTVVNAYFNKGKYMMNMDLYAYNEQDLATA
jgi:hypothetical protein